MKAEKLLRMCRVLYPSRIEIGDARILGPGRAFVPGLAKAWDEAEHQVAPHETWRKLGVRALLGALTDRAIRDRLRGRIEVRTQTVTLDDFDLKVRLSLRPEEWTQERRAWRAANGRRLTL